MKTKFGDKLEKISDELLRKRLRTCLVLAAIAALILSCYIIILLPDVVESMSKAIEGTELEPPLNDGRHNSHGDVLIFLSCIVADILFINFFLRSLRIYKIRYGYSDRKLISDKKYFTLLGLWLKE